MPRALAWFVVLVLALVPVAGVSAHQLDVARALANATAWLVTQQRPDGGFAGFSGESDPGMTVDAVLALAAAGLDPAQPHPEHGTSPVAYLASAANSYGQKPGGAAKLALAAVASGRNPRAFGGVDLVARLEQAYDRQTGLYDQQLFSNAYALLALAAAGVNVPEAAVQAVLARQASDGSWAWDGSTEPGAGDSNTTALVVQALAALGYADHPAVARALQYLRSVQAPDGAFAYQPADPLVGDANSTALVVQALLAVGEEPQSVDWRFALDALARFANPSGALRWRDDAPDDNLFATVQAIPALARQPFPLRAVVDPLAAAREPWAIEEPGCRSFPETGQSLCGAFLETWEQLGGLPNFGYPLTRAFYDPHLGLVVQYTERVRFELHRLADGSEVVLLGRLGAERLPTEPSQPFAPAEPSQASDCVYFPETQHNLCAGFRAYWERFGGLAVFGYPLSEEFVEDGMAVQYFERARFEWHPGAWPDRFDVLLTRLGAEVVEAGS
ncbi:terpene cyclase/mutase family protein [Thermomicrobium sp. 4228-Ro]|uniref:prenyltransferase/squalene oxidase repeat-containing protein n=1 Tax=Thermomicrobium sp. 4228-Ro TaxID=2993937 RepID=UPI00224900BA|nr:prenyltransferase/squalene oxidase repeat-containing protein [Thermomicrobium sp. 4228-Ro]MCX2727177.1 terpene cyclase/mutase family protein [Thermomicrobium sp. 4228-Ro]